jgi:hypothetical protein
VKGLGEDWRDVAASLGKGNVRVMSNCILWLNALRRTGWIEILC